MLGILNIFAYEYVSYLKAQWQNKNEYKELVYKVNRKKRHLY